MGPNKKITRSVILQYKYWIDRYMKKNKVSNDDQMFSKKENPDLIVDDVGILGAGGYVPKRFYKWHHGLFPGSRRVGGRGLRPSRFPAWLDSAIRLKNP